MFRLGVAVGFAYIATVLYLVSRVCFFVRLWLSSPDVGEQSWIDGYTEGHNEGYKAGYKAGRGGHA